ncbi:gypsy retrotransposon integrase-like protein 1 [Plakobranchus ocellatus]|uniref:Gypsy retrotransposon integrase-like protein 1 n=1 Tax=Plakobranchus ocellatus TaxID=259542 RepID=A0AAV3YHZ0_9GAST|nr:gypsy retrotransposon integrase-like protein 1 [Plakobranchus ocellatus]
MHNQTRNFRAGTTAPITTSADKIKEISEATHYVDQAEDEECHPEATTMASYTNTRRRRQFCLSLIKQANINYTSSQERLMIADIIDKPFDKVAIDIVGPMMMSDSKNRFILTLVDAATRWPEAVPLKSISTTDVANALFNIFTRLEVPKEILSDNGQQLVSKAMEEVMTMMGIQRRLSTPYHAQSNGMVERFNGSLKTMLRKLCTEKPQTWDKMIPAVLFAYREIPNVTTGYPPFMLMYGRRVRGPADMIADQYIGQQNTLKEAAFVHEYAKNLQREITDSCKIAAETAKNQLQSYREAKSDHRRYREFAKGDKVLILLPQDENNLFMKYQGPYKIDGVAQNNNYIFIMRNGKRMYHANILKKYDERESSPPLQPVVENACTGFVRHKEYEEIVIVTTGTRSGKRQIRLHKNVQAAVDNPKGMKLNSIRPWVVWKAV